MTTLVPAPAQPLRTFGGQIDVRVEIDTGGGAGFGDLWDEALWDESPWGADDPVWVDMTDWVLEVVINQGAERWGERFQAGSCVVTVDNTTGIFTPENGVPEPWFRAFRPGRRIRVVAIPDPDTGLKTPLFTGRLTESMDSYDDAGFDITTAISAIDYMGDWADYDPLEMTATGAQRTDLRVHAALNRYGWPTAERDIQTGLHNIASSTLAETTLEECQRAADAEGGAFFCSKDGLATFKDRDWLITDTRSVNIQGYVGYEEIPTGAQAAHADQPANSWALSRVVNHAAYAREGGTAQEAQDTASQAASGIRSHKRTDLLNTTDAEVLFLATRMVNAQKDLRPRFDDITLVAVDDPANEDLNRLLWDTEYGDRLAVLINTPHGWATEREAHVFGMSHQITVDDWIVRLRLDDAQTIDLTYWILGDPEFGVLDETTRLA